jgi:hypothetical protein
MSFGRAILIMVLGAAVALGADYALRHRGEPVLPEESAVPTVSSNLPDNPGDPPIAWLEGTIEELEASTLTLREGEGPSIPIRRFEEGATDFLRLVDGSWRQLTEAEVEQLGPGGRACVEALLDGRTFFALRIFLGASCGPA